MIELSSSFTRPADTTAYASGDLVANSVTNTAVVPLTFNTSHGFLSIRRVRINKTGTAVANAQFRVHFYDTAPTVTNGDNGVWLSTQSNYMGFIDATVDKAFSDGASGQGATSLGLEINVKTPADYKIYALVEARAAYTPASAEVFTIVVEIQHARWEP